MNTRIALYPGSFDPVTNGHLDIIERVSGLFDKVIVAVLVNPQKNALFSEEERLVMLREVLMPFPHVVAESFSGLTVRYAQKRGAQAIIRGLRAISDFENEFMMALTNKKLAPSVETVFLMTRAEYSFINSNGVKEVASYGGCLRDLVPPPVEKMLRGKYGMPSG